MLPRFTALVITGKTYHPNLPPNFDEPVSWYVITYYEDIDLI